jgi:hypothetical protein
LDIREDAVDPTERGVLIGLVFITAVCGAVLLWVNHTIAAPMDFIERFGFFTRRWRRFNGSFVHYRTCHDLHSGGIPLGV